MSLRRRWPRTAIVVAIAATLLDWVVITLLAYAYATNAQFRAIVANVWTLIATGG